MKKKISVLLLVVLLMTQVISFAEPVSAEVTPDPTATAAEPFMAAPVVLDTIETTPEQTPQTTEVTAQEPVIITDAQAISTEESAPAEVIVSDAPAQVSVEVVPQTTEQTVSAPETVTEQPTVMMPAAAVEPPVNTYLPIKDGDRSQLCNLDWYAESLNDLDLYDYSNNGFNYKVNCESINTASGGVFYIQHWSDDNASGDDTIYWRMALASKYELKGAVVTLKAAGLQQGYWQQESKWFQKFTGITSMPNEFRVYDVNVSGDTATFKVDFPANSSGNVQFTSKVPDVRGVDYTASATLKAPLGYGQGTCPAPISVPVQKTWDGKPHTIPASIKVGLVADGVLTDKVITLSAAQDWKGTFTDLAPITAGGQSISYSVQELTKVSGYVAEVVSDGSGGFIINNKNTGYTPILDGDNSTPCVVDWRVGSINDPSLYDYTNNGFTYKVNCFSVNPESTGVFYIQHFNIGQSVAWRIAMASKYELKGAVVTLKAPELSFGAIQGADLFARFTTLTDFPNAIKVYDMVIEGDTATFKVDFPANSSGNVQFISNVADGASTVYTADATLKGQWNAGEGTCPLPIPQKQVTAQKVWSGGVGTDQVTLRLLADGQEVAVQTASVQNDFTVDFGMRPLLNEDRQPITYTIKEDAVAGYTPAITLTETETALQFTVTNTALPVILPEQPQTTEPTPSEPVHTPSEPVQTPTETTKPVVKNELPETGAGDSLPILLGGLILLSFGVLIIRRRNIKE